MQALRARAAEEGIEVAIVSARVEAELNELPKEEAKARGMCSVFVSVSNHHHA